VPEPKQNDPLTDASRLLTIVNSSWMSQATRVAAELGLADLLADGPRSAADLAEATGTHAPSLHRLLRALVTIDVCREQADGTFAVTSMGRLLGRDAEGSIHSWTIYWGRELWSEWAHLLDSISTGRSGREIASGMPGFESLREDPERAAVFNAAMAELTRLTTSGVVAGYDFTGLSRIMDVGGGYGRLLAAVLTANPGTTGVLFDLPHAIENARPHLEKCGVADRCELVTGSFFEEIPGGADAYLLKSVLHDWDDERSHAILTTCRRAMTGSARLLVIERLLPERMEPSETHRALARADLHMLVAHAAQERTEAQFRDLLAAAGFATTTVTPIATGFSVIEAVPAP
jgi:orsellinic acid C2-O-methyltransferase